MEIGGAWCPNQQATRLPTRANDEEETSRGPEKEFNPREKAKSHVVVSAKCRAVCELFIVNVRIDYCWQCHQHNS
jgi:hypothetical protein